MMYPIKPRMEVLSERNSSQHHPQEVVHDTGRKIEAPKVWKGKGSRRG